MTRRVVLVCGAPGAGKTTYAKSLGLDLYDVDDAKWRNSERAFTEALRRLAAQPNARAVVIRAGATRAARERAVALAGVTETHILATPRDVCMRRVTERNRPPVKMQIAAVAKWWKQYEPDASACTFIPQAIGGGAEPMPDQRTGRAWKALVDQCKQTYPWVCHLCGEAIPPGLDRNHPLAYQADHIQPVKTHPHLAMVLANLRPSHRQCNNYRKAREFTPSLVAEVTARFAQPVTRPALSFFDH